MKRSTGFPTFDSAIRFLETQLEAIDQRRARVAAALDGLRMFAEAPHVVPSKASKRTSGTAAIVLAVMRAGADKLSGIAKDAKIKQSTAREAVLALERDGKVKREGKGPSTRYKVAA